MRKIVSWFLPILFAGAVVVNAETPPNDPQTGPGLEDAGREFVALLADGEFADAVARFDETMKAALSEKKLKAAWEDVVAQAGAFLAQAGVRIEKVQVYDIVVVTCRFENAPFDVRVVLDASRRVAGLFFAPAAAPLPSAVPKEPAYADPNAFTESEVVVGDGEWALPGTLTLPKGEVPVPAVVLVHGSGPLDRDETVGPNKPFRDIAWGLASKGIAVLRYDKRTLAHASKMMSVIQELTVQEETVEDALAAVRLLRAREDIHSDAVFVLGHSQGGMLVPRISEQDDTIRGFVVMAGPARPLHTLLPEQVEYLAGVDGTISDAEKKGIAEMRKRVEEIDALEGDAVSSDSELILGAAPAFWLDLRDYHPHEAAKEMNRPLLILHGGRDYQVTRKDFSLWKSSLGSREDVQLELYPRLNHLFIEGDGVSSPAEYQVPGNVSGQVIGDVAEWILKNTEAPAG